MMSEPYRPGGRPASGLGLALGAVWVAFTVSAVLFVYTFGSNAPYADEWEFVPALVGVEPGLPWLWAQHNEHRLPLPRAVYLILFRWTHDFRAGSYLQVGILSALALALMRYAARLRGRPDWPDAFFPVSLLHLGHWENFIMGYQLCFVTYAVVVTGLVVVALNASRATAGRDGLRAGLLLVALVLTGGTGLAAAPPVAVWVLYLAGLTWRAGRRTRAALVAGLAVLALLYYVPYFTDYMPPPHHPPKSYDPGAILMVAAQAWALALGPGVAGVWPAVWAGEVALMVATAWLVARRSPDDRVAAWGLLAVWAGGALLALAIGHGRAAMGPEMGLYSRYALLTWPLIGGAYLAWVRAGRKGVPAAVCLLTVLAFLPNMGTGMTIGQSIREHYRRMAADVAEGRSAAEIVAVHFPRSPNQFQEERAVRGIPLLQAAGIGLFAGK